MKKMDEIKRDALQMVFQHQTEELRFIKSTQWNITNYTILLYAGITTAISMITNKISCYEIDKILSIAIIITLAIVATILSSWNFTTIERRREKIESIIRDKDKLGPYLPDLQPTRHQEQKEKENSLIKFFVYSAIILGGLISIIITIFV